MGDSERSYPPRSQCESCKRQLRWFELIPIFSYLIIKAQCLTCGVRLSSTFFLAELFTAIFYEWLYLEHHPLYEAFLLLLIYHLLLMASLTDLYYWIIPDRLHVIFFFLSIPPLIFAPFSHLPIQLMGLLCGFFLPLLVAVCSRNGLGGGDIKLFMSVGWIGGLPLLLMTMMTASLTGMVFFLLSILCKRKASFLQKIPFAPFIFLGFLVSLFFRSNGTNGWL